MKTLEEFIAFLDNSLQDASDNAFDKAIQENTGVILGIDRIAADSEIFRTQKNLDITNQLFDPYLKLFPGQKKSFETFINGLLPFMKISPAELSKKLRLAWVEHNNVKLPEAFDTELMLFALKLQPYQKEAFEQFESLSSAWNTTRLTEYNKDEFWDESSTELKVSEKVKERIYNKHQVKATQKDLLFAASLSLVESGLNNILSLVNSGFAGPDRFRNELLAAIEIEPSNSKISKVIEIALCSLTENKDRKDFTIANTKKTERGLTLSKTEEKGIVINWSAIMRDRLDYDLNKMDLHKFSFLPVPVMVPDPNEKIKKLA